jgi:hypothetical protein
MFMLPVGIQRGITCARAIVFKINVATSTDRIEVNECRTIFLACFIRITPSAVNDAEAHDFGTMKYGGVTISRQ